jgi:asparagine synthase (glutamine-hydrolysing)
MCGVCGIYHYGTGEPAEQVLLRKMTASLIHRGPDDDGFHVEGPLALGMRRLSIIDLEGGSQPTWNENGRVAIVLNGEIYNFRELRRELEAHGQVFRTHSDTEAIVHTYEQWGLSGLARLNGMYGLAVWDAERRRLVVARDPFGIKPVYHWDNGRTLLFGSENRPILCSPEVRREVDPQAVEELVDFTYVPAPRTAFRGIQKLLPGHAFVYGEAGGRIERFHCMVPSPHTASTEDELVDELREAIAAAVRRQMAADVPVGAMLSGGRRLGGDRGRHDGGCGRSDRHVHRRVRRRFPRRRARHRAGSRPPGRQPASRNRDLARRVRRLPAPVNLASGRARGDDFDPRVLPRLGARPRAREGRAYRPGGG